MVMPNEDINFPDIPRTTTIGENKEVLLYENNETNPVQRIATEDLRTSLGVTNTGGGATEPIIPSARRGWSQTAKTYSDGRIASITWTRANVTRHQTYTRTESELTIRVYNGATATGSPLETYVYDRTTKLWSYNPSTNGDG